MSCEIAPWRINLLRAAYLLIAGGLAVVVWPGVLDPSKSWAYSDGVVVAMLAAMGLVAVLGLWRPLKMLPLLFFELTWKAIWMVRVALPLWSAHRLVGDFAATASECLVVVLIVPAIPWDYVARAFLTGPAEPWRRAAAKVTASSHA